MTTTIVASNLEAASQNDIPVRVPTLIIARSSGSDSQLLADCLKTKMRKLGHKVILVPDPISTRTKEGIYPDTVGMDQFLRSTVDLTIHTEAVYKADALAYARKNSGERVLLVSTWGIPDISTHFGKDALDRVLAFGTSLEQHQRRYDAVVERAFGPGLQTQQTNPDRFNPWSGHPNRTLLPFDDTAETQQQLLNTALALFAPQGD